MKNDSPVIHAESSDARNTAAGAMSPGRPMRPSGVCDSTCLRKSLSAMRVHRALRRTVDRPVRDPRGGHHRADVDDAAALRAEVLDCLLRTEDQAQDVQVELLVEVLRGDGFDRCELVDARVVHQDVEPAERRLRLREQAADVRLLREVRLHRDRLTAGPLDLRHNLVGAGLARRVVHHHRRTLRGELLRDLGSDALRRAGDHGDLPGELVRVRGHD